MNLEVGMYVRKKDYPHYRSRIGKIDGLIRTPNTYHLDCEESHCITTIDSIQKASHNIIDLIEEKDVLKIYTDNIVGKCEVKKDDEGLYIINPANIRMPISYFDENKEHCWWIESILTHEQFSSMEYKVNE